MTSPMTAGDIGEGLQWRDVPGWAQYEVSNLGDVRRRGRPQNLKPSSNRGYLRISLHEKPRKRTVPVHTLVALAWLGPRPKSMEINHLNGVKTDNRADNLEYCTPGANVAHATALGLYRTGERHHCSRRPETRAWGTKSGTSKLDERVALQILLDATGDTYAQIAERFGVSRATVASLRKARTWAHVWSAIEPDRSVGRARERRGPKPRLYRLRPEFSGNIDLAVAHITTDLGRAVAQELQKRDD